jgi:hypothetical protein
LKRNTEKENYEEANECAPSQFLSPNRKKKLSNCQIFSVFGYEVLPEKIKYFKTNYCITEPHNQAVHNSVKPCDNG